MHAWQKIKSENDITSRNISNKSNISVNSTFWPFLCLIKKVTRQYLLNYLVSIADVLEFLFCTWGSENHTTKNYKLILLASSTEPPKLCSQTISSRLQLSQIHLTYQVMSYSFRKQELQDSLVNIRMKLPCKFAISCEHPATQINCQRSGKT